MVSGGTFASVDFRTTSSDASLPESVFFVSSFTFSITGGAPMVTITRKTTSRLTISFMRESKAEANVPLQSSQSSSSVSINGNQTWTSLEFDSVAL